MSGTHHIAKNAALICGINITTISKQGINEQLRITKTQQRKSCCKYDLRKMQRKESN